MKDFIEKLRGSRGLQAAVVLAIVIALSTSFLVISQGDSGKSKVKGPVRTEARSIQLVQQLIVDSHGLTMKENSAAVRIWTCGNVYQATSDFDLVAAERGNLVVRAQMVTFKRSKKANDALVALASYLDYTSQADARFATWGRSVSHSCNWGNAGYRISAPNPAQASTLKRLGNDQKLRFITLWNEFAISNDLSLVGIADI